MAAGLGICVQESDINFTALQRPLIIVMKNTGQFRDVFMALKAIIF